VRRFCLKFFFASKRNEAKRDSFRIVFACSSENQGPIFSLVFASFRFECFASKAKRKKFFALFRFTNFCFASIFAVTNIITTEAFSRTSLASIAYILDTVLYVHCTSADVYAIEHFPLWWHHNFQNIYLSVVHKIRSLFCSSTV
jgi:hypothetical protein